MQGPQMDYDDIRTVCCPGIEPPQDAPARDAFSVPSVGSTSAPFFFLRNDANT